MQGLDFTRQNERYDVVFDCIGNHPYRACKGVLRGKWVHVTTMPKTGTFPRQFLNPLFRGRVATVIAKPTGERMRYIKTLIDAGKMRTVIAKEFPAAEVSAAQSFSKTGRAKGKIVLEFET